MNRLILKVNAPIENPHEAVNNARCSSTRVEYRRTHHILGESRNCLDDLLMIFALYSNT